MEDAWMKKLPNGRSVTYKIVGSNESGFVYSAHVEGRAALEQGGRLEQPTREQVEAEFADYVAEG